MQLNPIIFPAPKISYNENSKNIIWITGDEPKSAHQKVFTRKFQNYKVKAKILSNNTQQQYINPQTNLNQQNSSTNKKESENIQPEKQIPCLYLPYSKGSNIIIMYFHGNAEDLGYSYDFTDSLRNQLQVNVLSVEYPGYGAYNGSPSSEQILEDAEIVFDFLTNSLNICSKNIFVFGRSIGSGPATHLASKRRPGALLLMCPYTSIRDIVKSLVGSLISKLVADRFKNIEKIEKVRCPCFFVHGQKDSLIPYGHSVELMSKCQGISYLNLSPTMTHNEFKMIDDVINPLQNFFKKCGIKIEVANPQNSIKLNPLIFRKNKLQSIMRNIEDKENNQNH